MPDQSPGAHDAPPSVFDASLQVLQSVITWLEGHQARHPDRDPTVLVGGWAVYIHNDWEKSRDIDLVVSRSVRKSLERHLVEDHGFVKEPRRAGLKERVVKHLDGVTEEIWFDFAGLEDFDSYEGHPDVEIGYQEALAHAEYHDLEGARIQIPDRTQMIIYKTKAAWDRHHRLEAGASENPVWERGKLAKDYGDIVALLDGIGTSGPPLSMNRLVDAMERAPFTIQVWKRLAGHAALRARYPRRDDAESQRLVRQLVDAVPEELRE